MATASAPPTTTPAVVTSTDLPFPVFRRGKVRDVYILADPKDATKDKLLMVATDRISAFDVVLSPGIPHKGTCLTQMSNFWFDQVSDMVPNHLVATETADFPRSLAPYEALLRGRAVVAEKLQPLPVECVVRGYLVGSGWKDYQKTGAVCGIPLPSGLKESQKLPQTLFTPSTKAEKGHDENIPFSEVEKLVGARTAAQLRDLSIALYEKAARYAKSRGIIIADTKFEFGKRADGTIVLMDEILTPDSSRFWPAASYTAGQAQPSFDKQFLRDFCETTEWDKTPPGPTLPPDVVHGTAKRYYEAFERITGTPFQP
ncbi:MAG: phosphoribosylaminoimidazolesuccinocarboxamide synthase [Thermoplasmatota archaeon]